MEPLESPDLRGCRYSLISLGAGYAFWRPRSTVLDMRYISTRGQAPGARFRRRAAGRPRRGWRAVRPGDRWPLLSPADWRAMRGLPYAELAARVMQPFVGETIPFETLRRLCRRGLCRLRPPGGGAAGAARYRALGAGAVPRPDARLQGHGDAGARAAVRPCAGASAASASPSSARPRATPARPPSRPVAPGAASTS